MDSTSRLPEHWRGVSIRGLRLSRTVPIEEENAMGHFIVEVPVLTPCPLHARNAPVPLSNRKWKKVIFTVREIADVSQLLATSGSLTGARSLEVSFKGAGGYLEAFPHMPSLRKLVLYNVGVGSRFLEYLTTNQNLECLVFNNLKYNGGFDLLENLLNLKELGIDGVVPGLSINCSFLKSMNDLESVSSEMTSPKKQALEALRSCSALISLTLRGYLSTTTMEALSLVHNVKELTFVGPRSLEFPESFQNLTKLQKISFVSSTLEPCDVKGFENLPRSVFSLSIDNRSVYSWSLKSMSQALKARISDLSLRVPTVGREIGLGEFSGLEHFEVFANELDVEAICELKNPNHLKHLAIGGNLNVEQAILQHFGTLNLSSLVISNSMITRSALMGIQSLDSLREVSFCCCFFPSFNWEDLCDLGSVRKLTFDQCTPIEDQVVEISRSI
eukprot:g5581.t1